LSRPAASRFRPRTSLAVDGWPEEASIADPAGAPPPDDVPPDAAPRASEAVEPEPLSDAMPEPRRSPCAAALGRVEDGLAPVARPVEGVSGEAEAPPGAVAGDADEPGLVDCATAEVKAAGAPRRSAATAAPVRKRAVFKESSCMA
jgi:hypothetical protein